MQLKNDLTLYRYTDIGYIRDLKALIEVVSFASVGRPFQHFAPLNEKRFCPLAELLKGSLKSVFVFRRLRVVLTVFLVKISQRYLGAMLFKHLKTVRFTCLLISS